MVKYTFSLPFEATVTGHDFFEVEAETKEDAKQILLNCFNDNDYNTYFSYAGDLCWDSIDYRNAEELICEGEV